ncbi:MAG: hypothetical protein ROO73_02070 [Roseivirga sp.]
MNNWNPVSWFEIPAKDLDSSKRYYERLFDITLQEVEVSTRTYGPEDKKVKMALFPGGPGSTGPIGALVELKSHRITNEKGTIVYFQCEDLKDKLQYADGLGGDILMRKTPIGEYGFIAHFIDVAGNRIGLHSMQ